MSGASNQEKTIATKGSAHVARSGPPDVCLLPDKKTPIAPSHEVPTTRATQHTTAKTVIATDQIVQKGDAIGPLSDPEHAGTGKGVTSKTYRQEARATQGSPNVKTEAKEPARHTDKTEQNHANTTGGLKDMALNPNATSQPRKPEERCTVVEIDLICKHGRTTTPKDPVLDVLQGDTVTATATRKNLLLPGEPFAACPPAFPGRHTKTKFTTTRTGPDAAKDAKGPEEKPGVDTLELGSAWLGEETKPPTTTVNVPGVGPVEFEGKDMQSGSGRIETNAGAPAADRKPTFTVQNGATAAQPSSVFGRTVETPPDARTTRTGPVTQGFTPPPASTRYQDAVIRHTNQNGQQMQPGSGANLLNAAAARDAKETAAATQAAQTAHTADQRAAKAKAFIGAVRGGITGVQTVNSLRELTDNVTAKPKVITINGQGCAGSVTRSINVYPDKECVADIMKFKEVISALHAITMLFSAGQKFCDAIGFGNFKFSLLDPCACELKHAWKELEKDSTKDARLTKQRVNREFSISLGCSLVEFTAEGRIPVMQFVGGIPGAAKLAAKLRDWFNIAADIVIIIKLGIALKLVYARDRYKEHTINFDFNPSVEVSIGISLMASKVGITLVVGVTISPVFRATPHDTDYVQLKLLKGEVEFFVEGTLHYDVLGFKDELKKRYTFGKIPYNEQAFSLASWIGG